MDSDIERVNGYLQRLQNSITSELQGIDGKAEFETDVWQRDAGGGGRRTVLGVGGGVGHAGGQ